VRFEVLDHGYIEAIDIMGSDETIIEAARVSTGKGFQGWNKDLKLLRYLWVNKHTSPFEQCELSFDVQAPIMVFREWMRHRTQSYNEMSGRHVQMPNLHCLPEPGRVKGQSKTNKQGSDGEVDPAIVAELLERFKREQDLIYETYEWALEHGVSKEVARWNTPISRYSRMRAKANLLNWLKFCALRMNEGAQWEIRQYANEVGRVIGECFPRTWALFLEHRL
jgi:thymidylate synthase (FAD)